MSFLLIMAFSAAFKTWLATEGLFRNYVAKLQAHDGTSVVTKYVSSVPYQTLGIDTPAAEQVLGGLDEDVMRAWLSGNNPWSHPTGGAGTGLIFIHDPAGDLDEWLTWNFKGYGQEILLGGPDLASGLMSDYERVLLRTGDTIRASEHGGLTIPLLDPMDQMDTPYQPTRYSAQTNEAINGLPKPRVVGNVRYATAALVDQTTLDFEVDDSTSVEIDQIFSNGYELEQSTGTAGVWDSDGDDTITVTTTTTLTDVSRETVSIDYDSLSSEASAFVEFELLGAISGFGITDTADITISLQDGATRDDLVVLNVLNDSTIDGNLVVYDEGSEQQTIRLGDDSTGGNINGYRIVVGVLFDWANLQATFYLDNAVIGTHSLSDYSGTTKDWEIRGHIDVFEDTGGTVVGTIEAHFDQSTWVFGPSGIPDLRGWGTYGAATIQSNEKFRLVNNPRGAKITTHSAQQSPQGFESWSVGTQTISGSPARTVTATDGTLGGCLLPMPRQYGDLVFEVKVDALTGSGAPEIGFTQMQSGGESTIASRIEAATYADVAGVMSDAGVVRFDTSTLTGGDTFAATDVIAWRLDFDNSNAHCFKNGTEVTGSPFDLGEIASDHVFSPLVVTDTSGDKFTIRTSAEDMDHFSSYGGATAWGERMALPEMLNDVASSYLDLEQAFIDVATSGFCPTLGYVEMANGRHRQTSDVVRWLARSQGCGLWWDRDNQLRLLIMRDLSGATADHTIVRDDDVAIGDMTYEIDRAEELTATVESYRVWAPHREGEIATALSLEEQTLVAREMGIVSEASTASLHASYSHVDDAPALVTLLQDGDPLDDTPARSGDDLAADAIALYASLRGYVRSDNTFLIDVEPGQVIDFTHTRWGMSAGKKFLVIDAENDDINGKTDLLLWG